MQIPASILERVLQAAEGRLGESSATTPAGVTYERPAALVCRSPLAPGEPGELPRMAVVLAQPPEKLGETGELRAPGSVTSEVFAAVVCQVEGSNESGAPGLDTLLDPLRSWAIIALLYDWTEPRPFGGLVERAEYVGARWDRDQAGVPFGEVMLFFRFQLATDAADPTTLSPVA
ncbi:MAG TPA: hypothetical protein VF746_13385 [Longimicrobium sp.]